MSDQAACQGCSGSKSQGLALGWLQRVCPFPHISPEALGPRGRTGNCLDVGIREKEWLEFFILETGPLIFPFNLKCRYNNIITNAYCNAKENIQYLLKASIIYFSRCYQ